METEDERKFARISLLDASDSEDDGRLTSPLSPKTASVKTKKTASINISEAGEFCASPESASQRSIDPFASAEDRQARGQDPRASSEIPTSTAAPSTYDSEVQRRRGSSLSARWQGDQSHRPLDIIRRESLKAHRSPHLQKRAHHGPDIIDKLGGEVGAFHHEGPYDVASLARNQHWRNSPLEAIKDTNREALKSVHREKVLDSLQHHRPLDGFAFVPPGIRDQHGRIFHYEEGTDMMRFDGADYRRWEGVDYHPDDLLGKGEPSFSIERALKASSRNPRDHRRIMSEGGAATGIELSTRPNRTRSLHHPPRPMHVAGTGNEPTYSEWQTDLRRTGSAGHAEGMRRRLASVRRRGPLVDLAQEEKPVEEIVEEENAEVEKQK